MKDSKLRTYHLGIRLNMAEQHLLDRLAKYSGIKKSECARLLLFTGLLRELKKYE